jgi:hypothetical protein
MLCLTTKKYCSWMSDQPIDKIVSPNAFSVESRIKSICNLQVAGEATRDEFASKLVALDSILWIYVIYLCTFKPNYASIQNASQKPFKLTPRNNSYSSYCRIHTTLSSKFSNILDLGSPHKSCRPSNRSQSAHVDKPHGISSLLPHQNAGNLHNLQGV